MRIAFVWQESSKPEVFSHWNDGLRAAMRIIEKDHQVSYHEPFDEIPECDLVLYWEAPITINGQDSHNYRRIQSLPCKKALLFAGGMLKKEWVDGFDMVFVESQVNADECQAQGIPHMTAFGVNTDVFKPVVQAKVFDAVHHGTFAGWKRPRLLAEALGPRALLVGKFQEHERILYEESQRLGACVLPKADYSLLPYLIQSAHVCVNPSEYWGGGQRTTLEALACGLPTVVMKDSVKNREYVEESGCGEVVEPDPNRIRESVQRLKESWSREDAERAIAYIESKWTHRHYAAALLKGINVIMKLDNP